MAEITWLVRLLADLGAPVSSPVPIHCDSQSAISIAKNPVAHERTKHIELDCHFVREKLATGLISLHYVHTGSQLADILTKTLWCPSSISSVQAGCFVTLQLEGGCWTIRPN